MKRIENPVLGQIETINGAVAMFLLCEGGKQIWLAVKAPEKLILNWGDAYNYCKEQGGMLPSENTLQFMAKNFASIGEECKLKPYWHWSADYSRISAKAVILHSGLNVVMPKSALNYYRCVFEV